MDVQHLPQWEEDAALERGEGHDRADRDVRVAVDDQGASEHVDEGRRDGEEGPDQREEPAADHLLPDLEVAEPPRLAPELLDAGRLLTKGVDIANKTQSVDG